MIGSGTTLPGSMYLFSYMVKPPYFFDQGIECYFMCKINVKHVKFPVLLNNIPLLVNNNMRIISFI